MGDPLDAAAPLAADGAGTMTLAGAAMILAVLTALLFVWVAIGR